MSDFTLLDTAVARADDAGALREFLGRAWRLPSFAGTYVHHSPAPGLPGPAALPRITRALTGRMVVLNPARVVRLPGTLTVTARGVAQRLIAPTPVAEQTPLDPGAPVDPRVAAEAARTRGALDALPQVQALGGGWDWCVVALAETRTPVGGHMSVTNEAVPVGHDLIFTLDVRYRLVLVPGRGAPPDHADAREMAVAALADESPTWVWTHLRAPVIWLETDILLPEARALEWMPRMTAAAWMRVTGRQGEDEHYWHLGAWERQVEPGQRVGHVSPAFIARRGVLPGAPVDSVFGALALSVAASPSFSPRHDVGQLVPPGYCLATVRGTFELTVVPAPAAVPL